MSYRPLKMLALEGLPAGSVCDTCGLNQQFVKTMCVFLLRICNFNRVCPRGAFFTCSLKPSTVGLNFFFGGVLKSKIFLNFTSLKFVFTIYNVISTFLQKSESLLQLYRTMYTNVIGVYKYDTVLRK